MRNEESGFLFLPDCEIFISLLQKNGELSKHPPAALCDSWAPIHIPTFDKDVEEPTTDATCGTAGVCSHCHLTVQYQEDPFEIISLLNPTPRFDGHASSIKPSSDLCTCQERFKRRSDGALLVGLALKCAELGHVQIRSIEVLVKRLPRVSTRDGSENETLSSVTQECSNSTVRASLIITLYIPEMNLSSSQNRQGQGRRSRQRFITSSSKALPEATQLLLSMFRSDWEFYESLRKNPRDLCRSVSKDTHRAPVPFFPSALALDEVYKRIDASQSPQDAKYSSSLSNSEPNPELHPYGRLSNDIWKYHIAAFLKAKSLDALRCSSKHFHRILRGVVPGLKLRLYSHQIRSLSWMRSREVQHITENNLALLENSKGARDWHGAATGGSTVLLRGRNSRSCVRISQYSGEEVLLRQDDPLSRSVARGGLLCDDPGLGKTITVLSLVLQTIGLSTKTVDVKAGSTQETNQSSHNKRSFEEIIFHEYWREQSIPTFRAQALNKLLARFIRDNYPDVCPFLDPIDPERDEVPDYYEKIKNPISLSTIRQRIESHHYDPLFTPFQDDVLLCFQNAVDYHSSESDLHRTAVYLSQRFVTASEDFQAEQVKIAKKSFSKATSKPNSSVAALVERHHKIRVQHALVQTSCTLLVVPSVLLEHWQDQIRLHVDKKFLTNKKPVVFEFDGTAPNNLKLEDIVRRCKVEKTHTPFLFIDKSGVKKLPSPQFLAMFSIILTTNQRFSNEWKNGSFEEEIRKEESGGDEGSRNKYVYDFKSSLAESEEACSLLKVNWLRMIVDEGHSMGKGTQNSAISFASWISAERRWAMTGTPTRQIASSSGLADLLNLMKYLQHDFFSRRQDGEVVWKNMIARGWARGMLSSFFRLRGLLSLLMVRHTKRDIVELPIPKYSSRFMEMGTEEIKTYNTLVCAIQSNLVVTSMKGKTSGQQDSLLHRNQAKHARAALRNVRLVCAGGTQVIPTITNLFWNEFLRDFEQYNPESNMVKKMEQYLSRATTEQVSPCDCCGTLLTTQLVVPCGDLVCTECFDPISNFCVVCGGQFDVDIFQKLQPGFAYEWLHNIKEEAKKRKPAASSETIHDEVALLDNARGVLAPQDDVNHHRRRAAKPGDGHECVYSARRTDGQCELCWKEHDSCNLLNPSHRCNVCFRNAELCPEFETKPSYVVEKLVALYEVQKKLEPSDLSRKKSPEIWYPNHERRPFKVIIYSQFKSVLNTVGDRLIRRCGTACIAEYWGSNRAKALHQFAYDKQCFCMLLGKDGSEGLDLSFVTNIIFLEQVYDRSVEEQVVARAWRMGAKGPVEVETLVAKNSVEELMVRLDDDLKRGLHNTDIQGIQAATEKGKTFEYQSAKLHFLLKSLKVVTTPDTNPLLAGSTDRKQILAELNMERVKSGITIKDTRPTKVRFASNDSIR